jgi:catechol 2,3-dioxygenase-like lactoylglutathione lyase family enzyme
MIDHLTLTVRDVDRSVAFYTRALGPLGYRVLMEFERVYGLGDGKPDFWLKQDDPPTNPQHLAFAARTRAAVDAFYAAALAAGARDNGPPGLREHYHPTYYAAFVIDPDGHPIEAVNHAEPAAGRRTPARRASRKAGTAAKARARKAPRAGRKPRAAKRRRR